MFTVDWDIKQTHRVAFAGMGGIAQGAHLPSYRGVGRSFGIEVVGGADPNPACRAAVEEAHGIPTFASVGEMLEAVEPEVVDVTILPGPVKDDVVRQCLDAGCHVLAQKPFTKDLAAAAALVTAARSAGRLLAVNVQARYAPAFRAARHVIEQGVVGDVLSAFVTSTFPLPGNTVVDMGIHEVDLLRFWIDADAQRVRASVTPLRDERAHVVIEADFGSAYGLVVEENHAAAIRPWSFRIHGTEGTIEGQEQFGSAESPFVNVFRAGRPPGEFEPVELGYPYVTDAFAHVMASLLHAVETGGEAPTSAADHLSSLAAVLAGERSVASGAFEKVEVVSC